MTLIAYVDDDTFIVASKYFEIICLKASRIMKNWIAFKPFLKFAIINTTKTMIEMNLHQLKIVRCKSLKCILFRPHH